MGRASQQNAGAQAGLSQMWSSAVSAGAPVPAGCPPQGRQCSESTAEGLPAMAVVSHSSHHVRRDLLYDRDNQDGVLCVSDARIMLGLVTAGVIRAVFLPLHVRLHSMKSCFGELGRPPHTRGS